jgi:predicted ArsR family transcriptional regulator
VPTIAMDAWSASIQLSPTMLFNILREILKTPAMEIILLLKRSTGMSVNELTAILNMSYMGVKQHCVTLEKNGYLDTRRRPKPTGRPEKVYRLTRKTEPLFPQTGNELSLDMLTTAEKVFGETAPQKLLFSFFQTRGDRYLAKLKGKSIIERAEEVAKFRMAEGCMSIVEYHPESGLEIIEFHNPFGEVARRYPMISELETEMIERVLNYPVERKVEEASGLLRIVFKIRALGS